MTVSGREGGREQAQHLCAHVPRHHVSADTSSSVCIVGMLRSKPTQKKNKAQPARRNKEGVISAGAASQQVNSPRCSPAQASKVDRVR